MTPQELIARLEASTAPDRGLDADIYCALHPEWQWDRSSQQPTGWVSTASGSGITCPVPFFTLSVDAAMGLLGPPGHPLWTVTLNGRSHGQHGMSWFAEVTIPSREFQGYSWDRPAIALCIAALKAGLL